MVSGRREGQEVNQRETRCGTLAATGRRPDDGRTAGRRPGGVRATRHSRSIAQR
jgi:hypothetical protein